MAKQYPLACATSSLNPFPAEQAAPHDLPSKIYAIGRAGFKGIELAFPDLLAYASQVKGFKVHDKAWDHLCAAAEKVRHQCDELGLEILMLQPFNNFEGWPEGSPERADAFERAKGWMRVMQAAGTSMIQVGSTDATKITSDKQALARDLAELCDMLAVNDQCLAYENWCWATVAPTWRDVLELAQLADRPNFGLCLDTFQTAGYEWGDPTTSTGRLLDKPKAELDQQYAESMARLTKEMPMDKVYLLQISDAYKPPEPFSKEADENGMRPRARWSAAYRPAPGAPGGYLPVVEMAKALVETGFRGWFSLEIFNGGPEGKGRAKRDLMHEANEIMAQTELFMEKVLP